jgi:hypothetical protein
MQYTEERPSSGAIARRKTGVFDALWRHLLPQAGEGVRAAIGFSRR